MLEREIIDGLLREGSIVTCFERVVDRRPDEPAVVAADGWLSFVDLDRAANRIAHVLQRRDEEENQPVLLFLEPGVWLVSAMMGVLKAGRFFVALDPGAPQERNKTIATDSGAAVGLTCGEIESPLAGGGLAEIELIEIDRLPREVSDERPSSPSGLHSTAALTYTSGSTGRPKGVVQTHGTILHNAGITSTVLSVSPHDRYTLLYPPSVNPAVRDVMTPLLSGASLYPFNIGVRGVSELPEWLTTEEISVYCSGVTLFQQFAELAGDRAPFSSVRMVKLGGEPVTRRTVELFRRCFEPPCGLYSGLGTTETGTVTVCMMDHHSPLPSSAPLLGDSAPDTVVELVGVDGARVPPGDAGEIVVESRFLSPGYWNDDELSMNRFEPAQSGEEGVYRYATGDLGRERPDGTLEHLGRADYQLKIRGYRIQLEEVESALEAIDGVGSAAVGPRTRADGDVDLIGYVVPERSLELDWAGLRRALLTRLPNAMVPVAFILLDQLPRTPNGKLDRHALEEASGRELSARRSYTYPRDPVETRIASLWREILGHEIIGIDEDFFDLGGDSLMAVELFAEIERRFGKELPLATLFEAPTVREQAVSLRDNLARAGLQPLVSWHATGSQPPIFCVPAVDGYAFVYRPLAYELGPEQPLHVLQFPGLDGRTPPLETVEALAAELINRMRAEQPTGPFSILGHSFGGMVAYEMARQLQEAGESVSLLAMCDSHTQDSVPWWSRVVRDVEIFGFGVGQVWRETGTDNGDSLSRRVSTTLNTLVHMAFRGYARRRLNTLVEHTIHEVRRVATAARRRYRLDGRLEIRDGRVVLYRAQPLPGTPRLWCRFIDSTNGWARHFVNRLEVNDVPGDHIQMLMPPHVAVLAEMLREAVKK